MQKNVVQISIIVVLIVLGVIFYFMQQNKSPLPTITPQNNATEEQPAQKMPESTPQQSIESQIESTATQETTSSQINE